MKEDNPLYLNYRAAGGYYVKGLFRLKYIELGFGNNWLIRTETELPDGTECEERG